MAATAGGKAGARDQGRRVAGEEQQNSRPIGAKSGARGYWAGVALLSARFVALCGLVKPGAGPFRQAGRDGSCRAAPPDRRPACDSKTRAPRQDAPHGLGRQAREKAGGSCCLRSSPAPRPRARGEQPGLVTLPARRRRCTIAPGAASARRPAAGPHPFGGAGGAVAARPACPSTRARKPERLTVCQRVDFLTQGCLRLISGNGERAITSSEAIPAP